MLLPLWVSFPGDGDDMEMMVSQGKVDMANVAEESRSTRMTVKPLWYL